MKYLQHENSVFAIYTIAKHLRLYCAVFQLTSVMSLSEINIVPSDSWAPTDLHLMWMVDADHGGSPTSPDQETGIY